MWNLSIWQTLFVLFLSGLPVIGIATAGHVKQLQRVAYALRVVGLLIAFVIFGLVIPEEIERTFVHGGSDNVHTGAIPVSWLVYFAAIILGARWSAHRLHHIGVSRWWALVLLVPGLSFLPFMVLCLIPGKPQAAVQAD